VGAHEVLKLALNDLCARAAEEAALRRPQRDCPGGVHVAEHQPLHMLIKLRNTVTAFD